MNDKAYENSRPQGANSAAQVQTNGSAAEKNYAKFIIIALCAVIVLSFFGIGFYFIQNNSVAAVISLDVNPSVEIRINKNDKVLSCTPLNAEAAQVLFELDGGKDLEGAKLELAVNAVVGAFVKNGYSSGITFSVEDSDEERASRLKEELAGTVETALKNESAGNEVIGNVSAPVTSEAASEPSLDSLALEHGISVGKAALIERIVKLNSSLNWEQLSVLSADELEDLLESGAPDMPIGSERAEELARQYSGADNLDGVSAKTDSDIDDNPPHYEVEIYVNGREFEYKVHAFTGDILSGQPDISAVLQSVSAAALPSAPVQTSASAQTLPPQTAAAETTAQPVAAPKTEDAPSSSPLSYIGEEAAKQAAFAHAGVSFDSADYVNCHIDYDDGRPHCYEIEFLCGDICYEYDVDLYSGNILGCSHEKHRHNGHCHNGAANSSGINSGAADIGEDAALSAALTHAGKTLNQIYDLEIERDYDNGRLEYEIEFKCDFMEYKYKIDGYDGSVAEFEYDD